MSLKTMLMLLAFILFVLAAVGIKFPGERNRELMAAGLAVWMLAQIAPA